MNTPKLVIGNWKMHGSSTLLRAFGEAASRDWPGCEAALCVPYPLLSVAQARFAATPLRWGAQNCSAEDDGAFTGEISARMVREFGARYVIVGHSECRDRHGDTDGHVASKARRALAAGLVPIVCVGESEAERDGNQTALVLRRQLLQLARVLGPDMAAIVVAYEPIWAIGAGRSATPGLIDDTHGLIAEMLAFHVSLTTAAVRILYGGSVTPRNAESILARELVAGVLVGKASLVPADFMDICWAATHCGVARAPSRTDGASLHRAS